MNWHLDFDFPHLREQANFADPILMSGSCFTETIGGYLSDFKFDALINPHGILYNPASVIKSLKRCLDGRDYEDADLFFDHGLWHSWDHHGRFSDRDKAVCLDRINGILKKAHRQLLRANWMIITLGTSGVYRLKRSGEIVGNCHKLPGSEFDFQMLKPEEIIVLFQHFISELFERNSSVKIILTVSPVRYLKYGLIDNNISKSALLYAVHELVKQYDRVFYFPAYEIVMDELRDYRFYAEDLSHPNSIATGYVWDKFVNYFLTSEAKEIISAVKPVILAAKHRPLHPDSSVTETFVQAQLNKIEDIKKRYPFLDFEKEISKFKTEIR